MNAVSLAQREQVLESQGALSLIQRSASNLGAIVSKAADGHAGQLQAAGAALNERVGHLKDEISPAVKKMTGVFWSFSLFVSSVDLLFKGTGYLAAKRLDPNNPDTPQKVKEASKKFFVGGISAGGALMRFMEWSHSVKWISLGLLLTPVRALAFGSTALSSGIGLSDSIQEIRRMSQEEGFEACGVKKIYAIALLISKISLIAWAAIGLSSLVITSYYLQMAIHAAAFISFIASIVSMVIQLQISQTPVPQRIGG